MDLGLHAKTALVAGASAGLGKAIAIELAREGCVVGICARDETTLAAARDDIAAVGEAWSFACDLTDPNAARAFVQEGIARHGRVDILINNAGGPPPGGFLDLDDLAWEQAFRLTLQSAVAMTREALPGMIERKWGRVVNVTSASVKQPIDGLTLSNSIRLAVAGFAKSLSREVARHGITVNNVCPGYTHTQRVEALASNLARQQSVDEASVIAEWVSDIPMARIGRPEELAAVVAFLASERASYVTGTSILVDGGFVRGMS